MKNNSSRRDFLKTAAVGTAAVGMSALSYSRVHGANERIRIAQVGCGVRGIDAHMRGIQPFAEDHNVEIVAVSDPWRVPREEAAALCKEWFGIEAKQCVSYREVLEMDDVDAVCIASCDHHHATHMLDCAKAKKDMYAEKPIAMGLDELKTACDAVRDSGVVAQMGTQLRSKSSFTGVRQVVQEGVLGKINRIEQCRNSAEPYWYSRLKDVDEGDVDWAEFLMHREMRPFDQAQYSGWFGYRDFSDGAVPNLGVHYLDLVHYITGATHPVSSVCQGATFTWEDKYHFTCPDHVQATWIYPEGFMVSYTSNLGNGAGNSFKIFGEKGMIDCGDWDKPMLSGEGAVKGNACVEEPQRIEHIERPNHMENWLTCLRTRETPHAPIEAGYQQTIPAIMAMMAFDAGTRMRYDAEAREIAAG